MSDATSLELTADKRAELGNQTLQFILKYFDNASTTSIYPQADTKQIQNLLNVPLPMNGTNSARVLSDCFDLIAPNCRNNSHPRMFGYVVSPPTFIGAMADAIASTVNQNVTSWRSGPGPTEIEHITLNWIKEMVGYPRDSMGVILSGGSMANFAAISTALRAKCGVDINRDGLRALTKEPVIYASEMVHMSIAKAAEMLGLGRNSVRLINTKPDFTIDLDALDNAIKEDLVANKLPFCVVANAGDVNTGAVDPIGEVADLCDKHGLWCHVDGAYGGFAAMAPSVRPLFGSLSRADSLSLDPHKWLFVPLDAGCLLVKDAAALHAAFSHDAAYIKVLGADALTSFAFWDYSPELSRRFRALKIWATIRQYGAAALGQAIDKNIRLAKRLAELVEQSDDFELLAPVVLSIVCFRYAPKGVDTLDQLNSDIMVRVQKGGQAYISNTTINGKFALRACITNYRTAEKDLGMLLDTVRAAAIA